MTTGLTPRPPLSNPTEHQPATTNYGAPATNDQPPTTNFRKNAACCVQQRRRPLRTTNHQPRTTLASSFNLSSIAQKIKDEPELFLKLNQELSSFIKRSQDLEPTAPSKEIKSSHPVNPCNPWSALKSHPKSFPPPELRTMNDEQQTNSGLPASTGKLKDQAVGFRPSNTVYIPVEAGWRRVKQILLPTRFQPVSSAAQPASFDPRLATNRFWPHAIPRIVTGCNALCRFVSR